jgi:hypothetical protein
MGSSDFITRCVWALAGGAMLALSSCTLLFDPDKLRQGGDGGPPGSDGGVQRDAIPPGEFGLTFLEPATVQEGEGAAWPVPIIVRGQKIAPGATITLDGAGFIQSPVTATVAGDGSLIVFPLQVPVLEALAADQTDRITVTVLSDGESDSLQLTVQGLDELVASDVSQPDQVEAADLAPLYSRIHIDRDLTFTGSEPIRLVATAEIVLDGVLDANGRPADVATPGQGGPGGCVGGVPNGNGACSTGGGRGGGDDAPGGGGHFTMGTPGGGVPSNPGGVSTGRPEMVPLANEQGHGGGGALDVAGGGGGGIVELTSYGSFTVESGGSVEANGGRGAQGLCTGAVANGSGGGGSGGAILVRAWGGFDDQKNDTALSVRGGDGGAMAPNTDCEQVGGAGSAGRIRVDTSDLGGLPLFVPAQPPPFQGPLFRNRDAGDNPIPVVVTLPMLTLDLVGKPNDEFFLDVNGTNRESVLMSAAGAAAVLVQLSAGLNRICAVMDQTTSLQLSEGVQCISIAYIP